MIKYFLLFGLILLLHTKVNAQEKRFRACIIAFYNLENFYDTINNPMINDDDFTPSGIKHYNTSIYEDKTTKLATVLSLIGKEISVSGPAIIGVAEIENDTVLNDLVHHPLLYDRHYSIIHFNSKDPRGIDVGLLYDPVLFAPQKTFPVFVPMPGNSKEAFYTRDILYVKGSLAGETVHILVNHWPSRRGGEERSDPARQSAATVCRKIIDSVFVREPSAKIIVMGDFNDDPDSPSILKGLKAKTTIRSTHPQELFNPWYELYARGIGTLANRDSWGLFDQILLSQAWLETGQPGLFYHNRYIFTRDFMRENTGRYKGYPMRTWDSNTYRGGYSDHFPTYIVALRPLK